ncbi:MAG: hypothetical protein KIT84_43555 [Labilithrix sp.]|nr:hypothetical protein [Labilithrix sp.]MCW5817956.1 hypothetical protein [Labilithrix sp.]
MNARTRQVLEQALELTTEERALIETALDKELEQRIDDVVEGRVETRDVDDVDAELRTRYPRR